MKPLFNIENIKITPNDKLCFECYYCRKTFLARRSQINQALNISKNNKNAIKYCSNNCHKNDTKIKIVDVECKQCKTILQRPLYIVSRGKNLFCSRSCSATFNNTHKKTGTRRSKLEIWLESQLNSKYPNLDILYCNKTAINSELDIYIPSLSLAFELNGIYHYEPIHGSDKLNQIQNNDYRKFQACLEQAIELCIIDTSKLKYVKERNCQQFFTIISSIIDNKLV